MLWILNEKELLFFLLQYNTFTESNFCFKFNKKRTLNLPFVMNFKWKGTFTFTFTINLPSLILVQKNVSFLKYPNGGGGEVVERNGARAIFSNFWFSIISDNFQPKGTFEFFLLLFQIIFNQKELFFKKGTIGKVWYIAFHPFHSTLLFTLKHNHCVQN